jgi:hypothetical protein
VLLQLAQHSVLGFVNADLQHKSAA